MKKFIAALALSLSSASPAFAASAFNIDFEKLWDFGNGAVNSFYSGGTAADGSSGPNLGVSFTNVSGLSNDPPFIQYVNAPTPLGTAYVFATDPADRAFMNVAGGVTTGISFAYSSPTSVSSAVIAYAGLDGTGAQLGTFDLAANDFGGFPTQNPGGNYGTWTFVDFLFAGTALSFELTNSLDVVLFDEIGTLTDSGAASVIPVPAALPLLVGGLGLLGVVARRRNNKHVA
ncbi:MAG: hypothetical protein H7125_04880 [Proteobacteria bacterium]|nr:hypothetical protein [Burkholderiales bacterium]